MDKATIIDFLVSLPTLQDADIDYVLDDVRVEHFSWSVNYPRDPDFEVDGDPSIDVCEGHTPDDVVVLTEAKLRELRNLMENDLSKDLDIEGIRDKICDVVESFSHAYESGVFLYSVPNVGLSSVDGKEAFLSLIRIIRMAFGDIINGQ